MKNWNMIKNHNARGSNVEPDFGKLADWTDYLHNVLGEMWWRLCADEEEYYAFITWAHLHHMNVRAEGAKNLTIGLQVFNTAERKNWLDNLIED